MANQQIQQLVYIDGIPYLQNMPQQNNNNYYASMGPGLDGNGKSGLSNRAGLNGLTPYNPISTNVNQSKVNYTPNQFTAAQLSQFNQPQGMQGNPYYQQYLNKMNGMGAGMNMPSIAPTQGSK